MFKRSMAVHAHVEDVDIGWRQQQIRYEASKHVPRIKCQETSHGVRFTRNSDSTSFSCREELELTSVCDYYAKPHDLIRSPSLPCRLDRALYRGKKKIDHKDCEDDGNRLVLPF